MATFTKRNGRWRAQVRKDGKYQSKTFSTKKAAQQWAEDMEREIERGRGQLPNKPFWELLNRYALEVSPTKRGHVREQKMIAALLKDELAEVMLPDLSAADIAAWRDRRLRLVSGSTVNREMNILSHACNTARREWGWLHESPTADVRRPKENKPRNRRPLPEEIERLKLVMGYDENEPPQSVSARVCAAFLFACETAMRQGEIAGLTRDSIFERYAHLPETKNGHSRDVPLTLEARRILRHVSSVTRDAPTVFAVNEASISANFRKWKKRAGIDGLTFHDSRHEALTRLSTIYNVMELAKISGHRDLRVLQNVYYNPTAEDLADRLVDCSPPFMEGSSQC